MTKTKKKRGREEKTQNKTQKKRREGKRRENQTTI